jgi:hypothetical protein
VEEVLEDAGIHPNAHLFCHIFLSRADRRCNRAPPAVHGGAQRCRCTAGGALRCAWRCTSAPVRRPLCPLLPSSPTTEQEPNQPWRPLYRLVAAGGTRDHYHLRSTQQIHHRRPLMNASLRPGGGICHAESPQTV